LAVFLVESDLKQVFLLTIVHRNQELFDGCGRMMRSFRNCNCFERIHIASKCAQIQILSMMFWEAANLRGGYLSIDVDGRENTFVRQFAVELKFMLPVL
jgi:hypothetical protein